MRVLSLCRQSGWHIRTRSRSWPFWKFWQDVGLLSEGALRSFEDNRDESSALATQCETPCATRLSCHEICTILRAIGTIYAIRKIPHQENAEPAQNPTGKHYLNHASIGPIHYGIASPFEAGLKYITVWKQSKTLYEYPMILPKTSFKKIIIVPADLEIPEVLVLPSHPSRKMYNKQNEKLKDRKN